MHKQWEILYNPCCQCVRGLGLSLSLIGWENVSLMSQRWCNTGWSCRADSTTTTTCKQRLEITACWTCWTWSTDLQQNWTFPVIRIWWRARCVVFKSSISMFLVFVAIIPLHYYYYWYYCWAKTEKPSPCVVFIADVQHVGGSSFTCRYIHAFSPVSVSACCKAGTWGPEPAGASVTWILTLLSNQLIDYLFPQRRFLFLHFS